MLDSIHHMTFKNTLKPHFLRKNCTILSLCKQRCYGRFCFVALHPKSTAMVIAGRSVHLTTLFPGQA